MTYNIQPLFSTPILEGQIGRDITSIESEFVEIQKLDATRNTGNSRSRSSRILDVEEMKDIRSFIEQQINNYVCGVLCLPPQLDLYVTQSWLNYTEPGEYHHLHRHPNSFISGVFYFNADGESDKLVFDKQTSLLDDTFVVHPVAYNIFNSRSWWLSANTGKLFIFPSKLYHKVDTTTSKETRISLSFNTFFHGVLGDESSLTELILE